MKAIMKLLMLVVFVTLGTTAQAARYSVAISGVVLDNAGGKLDGTLNVGDAFQYIEYDQTRNIDTDPSPGAYAATDKSHQNFQFIVTITGFGMVTTSGSTTWVSTGILDLTTVSPGLYLPIVVTVNGLGMTPNQILPDFSSVTGGSVIVDMFNLTGVPGDQVVTSVTGVSLTAQPAAKGDLNSDGYSDLLMRDTSSGNWEAFAFFGGGLAMPNIPESINSSGDTQYMASMDANGDGMLDVLTRSVSTGVWTLYITENGGVTTVNTLAMTTDSNWQFQGVGDFDGDGMTDVLIRHATLGYWFVYFLKDGAVSSLASSSLFLTPDVTFQAAGDLNGDEVDDALLRSTSTGRWYIYNPVSNTVSVPQGLFINPVWQLQTLADLDGNGRQDIVLRITNPGHPYAGRWGGFMMNGSFNVSGSYVMSALPTALTETVATIGDFDRNLTTDFMLVNGTTGVYSAFGTVAASGQQTFTENSALNAAPWAVQK